MSYNTLIIPFLFMFIFASCISQTPVFAAESVDKVIIRVRYKVHILNGFADNAKPLIIHCHSKDDDLGQHTLWTNQEFRFKFIVSFVKTTRFICDFNWGSNSADNITVFENTLETETCKSTGNCFWKAAEDGIYFSNNDQNWERRIAW
ncbi:hypothetical protein CRYUN_Cryun29cG0032100 [Craigia yunnanensis]